MQVEQSFAEPRQAQPDEGREVLAERVAQLREAELPQKFREAIVHISLILEESLHAADDLERVHLHAQITFRQRIDRTSVADFVFQGVRPHAAAR